MAIEPKDAAAETDEDPFKDLRTSKPWNDMVDEHDRTFRSWHEKIERIEKLHADLEKLSAGGVDRQMQIFWANLEVLKPAVYSRPPVPVVSAKFKDRKELVRHGAEILERCLTSSWDATDIHSALKLVRDDFILAGRGVLWLRYEEKPDGYQCVRKEHIDRMDWGHSPARKWAEVANVWRKVYLTREEMRARFEETSGNLYLRAEYKQRKTSGDDRDDAEAEKKAEVREIWSKEHHAVVWVCAAVDQVLDIAEPPVTLEGFFPCPRPALGTLQARTLMPVPDYVYYKDQVEEINVLTARISALSEALRMKGFYSAGNEDVGDTIERALADTRSNAIMVPVPSVAALGNGMSDAIVWMPVQEVANTVQALVLLRKQLIDDVYQLTGLSDIMRGATDPNETLGAQQLKSQYGSVRVREKQEEMVRIARDAAQIEAEIIAENYRPETIQVMSQYDAVPTAAQIQQQILQLQTQVSQAAQNPQMVAQAQANPQMAQQMLQQVEQQKQQLTSQITFDQVLQMLREQRLRGFMLDIETDSTIQPDEDAAKQRTTEFLGALATALSQLVPMVQGNPQSAEFAGEVIKFAVAPFRAGRQLDAAVDTFVEKMKEQAGQPQPNPEQQKMEAEAAMQKQKAEADAAAKAAEAASKAKQREDEMAMKRAEHDMRMQEMAADRDYKLQERSLQREILEEKRGFDQESHKRAMETSKGERSMKRAEQGLPDEEVERMQAEAMVGTLQQTGQAMADMAASIAQGNQMIAEALDRLAYAQTAPKRVIKDANGSPVGVETMMQ